MTYTWDTCIYYMCLISVEYGITRDINTKGQCGSSNHIQPVYYKYKWRLIFVTTVEWFCSKRKQETLYFV